MFVLLRFHWFVPDVEVATVKDAFALHIVAHAHYFIVIDHERKSKAAEALVLKEFLASCIIPCPRREAVVPTPSGLVHESAVIRVDAARKKEFCPKFLLLVRSVVRQIVDVNTEF